MNETDGRRSFTTTTQSSRMVKRRSSRNFMRRSDSDSDITPLDTFNMENQRVPSTKCLGHVAFNDMDDDSAVGSNGVRRDSVKTVHDDDDFLNVCDEIEKKWDRKDKRKELVKQSSLNFQNPHSFRESYKNINQRVHPHGTSHYDDEKKEACFSNGLGTSSNDHTTLKAPQDKANEFSNDDDSFEFDPTLLIPYHHQRRAWIITWVCLVLFCTASLTYLFIRSNGENNSPQFRGTTTPQVNTTISTNYSANYETDEEDILESSHDVVKACLEGGEDTPRTCQEYCESKKCCFDESNCDEKLSVDHCIAYAACYSWVLDTYNVSSTENQGHVR